MTLGVVVLVVPVASGIAPHRRVQQQQCVRSPHIRAHTIAYDTWKHSWLSSRHICVSIFFGIHKIGSKSKKKRQKMCPVSDVTGSPPYYVIRILRIFSAL